MACRSPPVDKLGLVLVQLFLELSVCRSGIPIKRYGQLACLQVVKPIPLFDVEYTFPDILQDF